MTNDYLLQKLALIQGEALELRRRGFERQASELFSESYRLRRYIASQSRT